MDNYGIIGESLATKQILQTVQQVASTDISVLIVGESGTGKELVANAIHTASHRRHKPLVVVNCGAIPEGILESELFGHEKGAFTGAVGARKGYFELADNGTIFLDEIGEMPLATQVKLLRVLEGKDFMRVGGSQIQKVDVRVIAATNKELLKAVRNNEFREDLYYRLNAVNIVVPPLRERREDIVVITKKIVADFCRDNHIEFEGFTDSALKMLQNYNWPGNVRELKNTVESIIVLEKGRQIDEYTLERHISPGDQFGRNLPVPTYRDSEKVEREFIYHALLDLKAEISNLRQDLHQIFISEHRPKSLPYYSEVSPPPGEITVSEPTELPDSVDIAGKTLDELERIVIERALEQSRGSKRKAAQNLGISERTLYRKIKEYDLPY
jgi:transcriptional regulator with PAS, ATPase and Fis domain